MWFLLVEFESADTALYCPPVPFLSFSLYFDFQHVINSFNEPLKFITYKLDHVHLFLYAINIPLSTNVLRMQCLDTLLFMSFPTVQDVAI